MGLANLNLQSLIGGSIADAFAKVVGVFKVDPTAKMQAETDLQKIQLELQSKLQDAISNEITASAEIIKSEAQSQSWLPRNVRPLLLLLWGLLITFNYFLPLLAHFAQAFQGMQPLVLPDWLYKLTAIGFTGYVTARTWEKVTTSDQ
jgi:hypothetical protein